MEKKGMFFAQPNHAAFMTPKVRMEAHRMDQDRRRHKRIALKMTVCCQKVGLSDGRLYSGRTVNVSPGGMLIEMKSPGLKDGELLSVEMSVPPTEGLLDFGGSFSSYARVVRTSDKPQPYDPDNAVALEFCDSPKLRI
jgi:c-di-GMP-binding flagellar brake protein YcgR